MQVPRPRAGRLTRIVASALPAVVLLLLPAACGEGTPRRGAALPGGPPRWHALRGERPTEGTGLTIDVRSPVRLAVRYEGPETGIPQPEPRLVPSGTSVTLVWGHRAMAAGAGTQVAPPFAEAEGRTESQGLEHWFGWEDGPVESRPAPWWSRPGKGRVLVHQVAPPVVDEDLPVGSRIELVAAAVVDVATGEAELVPSPSGARLRMPSPGSPGDRSLLVRLWLEVLPP